MKEKFIEEIRVYRRPREQNALEHEFEIEQLKEMHAIESYEAAEKITRENAKLYSWWKKRPNGYEETLDHVREMRRLIDKAKVQYPGVEAIFENEIHTFRPDTSGRIGNGHGRALKLSATPPTKPQLKWNESESVVAPVAAATADSSDGTEENDVSAHVGWDYYYYYYCHL